jgi:hypothetical protein
VEVDDEDAEVLLGVTDITGALAAVLAIDV